MILHDCEITDDHIAIIAEGLKHCENLTIVQLNGNQISDEGAFTLCEALRHCRKLVLLNLERNVIEEDGAKFVIEMFRDLKAIDIQLHGNLVKESVIESFKMAPKNFETRFTVSIRKLDGIQKVTQLSMDIDYEGKFF